MTLLLIWRRYGTEKRKPQDEQIGLRQKWSFLLIFSLFLTQQWASLPNFVTGYQFGGNYQRFLVQPTEQKMKFSIKDFFSKCDQIRR